LCIYNYERDPYADMQERPHKLVSYFEIPVLDIGRSTKFYTEVFGFDFEIENIDGNEMALLPLSDNPNEISGALAKGESYEPTKDGVVIYFSTKSIDETLQKVLDSGGKIYYPKTSIGELGYVAEFIDSEGNKIALSQR
jgi:predicted enzyme related to lactoylglutathione lyase